MEKAQCHGDSRGTLGVDLTSREQVNVEVFHAILDRLIKGGEGQGLEVILLAVGVVLCCICTSWYSYISFLKLA